MARKSLRGSINAFCRECIYDPREPGRWREQVEACPSRSCPLYPVRPRAHGLTQDGRTRGTRELLVTRQEGPVAS